MHTFYEPVDVLENDNWGQRNIIHGGLSLCKICGALEGSLTTDCPGEKVEYKIVEKVYSGELDYKKDKGWVPEFNPTNLCWLYARYISFKGTDEQFAKENNLSKKYFIEIYAYWVKKKINTSKIRKGF